MNILADIVNDGRSRIKLFQDKCKAVKARKETNDGYMAHLSALSQETSALIQDSRYECQQEFLNESVRVLQDALQCVLVRDIKNLDINTLLKACTISAQIEAYQNILKRPSKVMDEIEKYQKMINKELA